MDVLLVNPPTNYALKSVLGLVSPPLALAYLASVAREEGFTTKIIDSPAEDLTLLDLGKIIRQEDPIVIGVTASTPMFPDACLLAQMAKKINPNIITVIGGPHVTFLPEKSIEECPFIDIVVKGEGENTFREILRYIDDRKKFSDIKGITFRDGDRIRSNPPRPLIRDIDEIPIPAFDLLPFDKYRVGSVNFGTIITSRGCPYNCVFCASSALFGHVFRAHSPERVLEEINILVNEFNIKEIEFLDDTFTLNRRRAKEISKRIIKEDLDISWSASSRVNTIDYETALIMKKAGAHTIYFGIESGTKKVLDFIGKGITKRQAFDAARLAKNVGLNVFGSFVIGFPIETRRDILTTIEFSKKLDIDYAQYTIATPYPGTRLWDFALEKNLLITRDWRKYTATETVMKSFFLSPSEIKQLFIKAYVSFYLRAKYILNDLVKRKGFLALKTIYNIIKGFVKKLFAK